MLAWLPNDWPSLLQAHLNGAVTIQEQGEEGEETEEAEEAGNVVSRPRLSSAWDAEEGEEAGKQPVVSRARLSSAWDEGEEAEEGEEADGEALLRKPALLQALPQSVLLQALLEALPEAHQELLSRLPADWEVQLKNLAHMVAFLPVDWEAQLRELAALKTSLPADSEALLRELALLRYSLPEGWAAQLDQLADLQARMPADWEAQLAQLAQLQALAADAASKACQTDDVHVSQVRVRVCVCERVHALLSSCMHLDPLATTRPTLHITPPRQAQAWPT
jgi:hypothetical protein